MPRKRTPGEGTIYYSESRGEHVAQLTMPDGRRRSFYGKTQREAGAKLSAARATRDRGLPVPARQQTVKAFIESWYADVAAPRLRNTTRIRYGYDVRRIAARWSRKKLADLTSQDIQAWLGEMTAAGLSASSVNHARAVLRSALEQAEAWGLIARNPASGKRVSAPRRTAPKREAMTPEQAARLIEAFAGHDLEPFVVVALGTGMRLGELLGLTWRHVDLDSARLTVAAQLQRIAGALTLTEPKSDRSRRVLPIGPEVIAALREQQSHQRLARLAAGPRWTDSGHVFTTASGKPRDPSSTIHVYQRQLERAGLAREGVHAMRHGAASLLIAEGATLREVMEQLGHAQISLTANLYTHLSETVKRENAARLDRAIRRPGRASHS